MHSYNFACVYNDVIMTILRITNYSVIKKVKSINYKHTITLLYLY